MKELIQLAEEKGFFGKLICNDQVYTQNKDYNEVSYVWMCELQKWLRDEHSKDIIPPLAFEDGYRNSIMAYSGCEVYETYEQALREGLTEALRQI